MAFCALAFLQVNNSSATVLNWLVSCITAAYLLNYLGTCLTYLHFYAAMRRQKIDRHVLPYQGYLQPYAAWYAVFGTSIMLLILGFDLFFPGQWDITTFFFFFFFLDYVMIAFFILAFVAWKAIRRTTYIKPGTANVENTS